MYMHNLNVFKQGIGVASIIISQEPKWFFQCNLWWCKDNANAKTKSVVMSPWQTIKFQKLLYHIKNHFKTKLADMYK